MNTLQDLVSEKKATTSTCHEDKINDELNRAIFVSGDHGNPVQETWKEAMLCMLDTQVQQLRAKGISVDFASILQLNKENIENASKFLPTIQQFNRS